VFHLEQVGLGLGLTFQNFGGQPQMFSEPITVTVNSVGKVMARISSKELSSQYANADSSFKLAISHQLSKGRVRSMARIDQRAIVADPLTSVNDYETLSFYCVVERPEVGFTTAQIEQLIAGFKTWLDNTAIDKIIGLES
jgi:hypothetical protein